MNFTNTKKIYSALFLISILLSACGGGGGGGGSAPATVPVITGAPTFSASSVIQDGSITVTVPVSGSGYVAACLSPLLASSPSMTMCNGGPVSGNSINIPITVAANATPASTYWVAITTCATQADCSSGNGIAYSSYNGSATYYSVTETQGTFVPPYTNTNYTIPQFTVTADSGTVAMIGAPVYSVSSVTQGGSIMVTAPVSSATGYVIACLAQSLGSSQTTMCGGSAPAGNYSAIAVNIDPAATPASTYYAIMLACATQADCNGGIGVIYSSYIGSSTYYSAPLAGYSAGAFTAAGYTIPQFSVTSSGGGGGGTGVIPGGITGVPVITPSSTYPGGVINVAVPVTNDTGWVKVCTKSRQSDWLSAANNYGCGDAAVSAGSASVNVTLSNPAPITSTYWVTLLACSTQADCVAETGLDYTLVDLGLLGLGAGYSTVYYSATTTAGIPNPVTLAATVYAIPYFPVMPTPVSTAYASPTVINLADNTQFQVGANAVGYVTFMANINTPYGIYVTDQSNPVTALALSANYDDGTGTTVAVAADGLSQTNLATLGFNTDTTAHTYVVKIDNSVGANPVTFSITGGGALSGGTAFDSATPLGFNFGGYISGDTSNGWYSFVPDAASTSMILSGLTHGMNIDLVDSDGVTKLMTTFNSTQDLFSPQNPFSAIPLTLGNTYYLHVTSQSLVVGAPAIGWVFVSIPP